MVVLGAVFPNEFPHSFHLLSTKGAHWLATPTPLPDCLVALAQLLFHIFPLIAISVIHVTLYDGSWMARVHLDIIYNCSFFWNSHRVGARSHCMETKIINSQMENWYLPRGWKSSIVRRSTYAALPCASTLWCTIIGNCNILEDELFVIAEITNLGLNIRFAIAEIFISSPVLQPEILAGCKIQKFLCDG